MPGPYWEVYPVDGDNRRCSINDVDELVKLIEQSLQEQKEGKNDEDTTSL